MPSEVFLFNAPKEARLEIWRMSITGQMLHVRADVSQYKTSLRDSNTEVLLTWGDFKIVINFRFSCFGKGFIKIGKDFIFVKTLENFSNIFLSLQEIFK